MESSRTVESLLQEISSRNASTAINDHKNEQGQSIRATGGATNNMILGMIQGECSRSADNIRDLYMQLDDIKSLMSQQTELIALLVSEMRASRTSAPSGSNKMSSIASHNKSSGGKDRYYKGVKLTSKFKIFTCLVSNILSMVYTRMQARGINYTDSVDCDFTELCGVVQTVCKSRCTVPHIHYSDPIELNEKKTAIMEVVCVNASYDEDSKTGSLPESKLGDIYNEATKDDIFVHVYRIIERLCVLEGVVSPKQIEALKSIGYPLAVADDGDPLRLNVDERFWKASRSHSITNHIRMLSYARKTRYIELLMAGKPPATAYGIAAEENLKK